MGRVRRQGKTKIFKIVKQGEACVCASLLFSLALEFSNQVAARGNVSLGHHTKASPVFVFACSENSLKYAFLGFKSDSKVPRDIDIFILFC